MRSSPGSGPAAPCRRTVATKGVAAASGDASVAAASAGTTVNRSSPTCDAAGVVCPSDSGMSYFSATYPTRWR